MGNKVLIISFSFEQEPDAFQALRSAGLEPVLWASGERKDAGEKELVAFWNALPEKPVGVVMGADVPITETSSRQPGGCGLSRSIARGMTT